MGWIGIADRQRGKFSAQGLDTLPQSNDSTGAAHSLLARGTLLLETRLSPEGKPQTLLAFHRDHPWLGSFSLQSIPNDGITLIEAQAGDVRHATLPYKPDGRTDIIRVTYSWDAPNKWGRLTLEQPEIKLFHSIELASPHPMLLADLKTIVTDPRQREMDTDVVFFAISDAIEPVGPMPGLTGGVPVATQQGYVPAGKLRRGDLVTTAQGETVPILQAVRRTVPARGSFAPVRLRAPYFGLRRDIVVAPQQQLVIGGSQVEYMFGSEAVLVPVQHLVNGVSAHYVKGVDLVTYHALLLPEHEAILAAGSPVESLYIGRLRRKLQHLAGSVLRNAERSRLPEHAKPIWPVLKPFEAVTLAMNRAA